MLEEEKVLEVEVVLEVVEVEVIELDEEVEEAQAHLLLQSASLLLTWLTFSRKLFLEVLRTSL